MVGTRVPNPRYRLVCIETDRNKDARSRQDLCVIGKSSPNSAAPLEAQLYGTTCGLVLFHDDTSSSHQVQLIGAQQNSPNSIAGRMMHKTVLRTPTNIANCSSHPLCLLPSPLIERSCFFTSTALDEVAKSTTRSPAITDERIVMASRI